MLTFTHALAPVVLKQTLDLRSASGDRVAYRHLAGQWLLIAVFGVLPDVLFPHISLSERYSAFSHVWPFTTAVVAGAIVISAIGSIVKRRYQTLPLWCGFAYVLHVGMDIISGGLDFLKTGNVIGDYYITPELWPLADLLLIALFILLNRRIRARFGLNPSVLAVLRAWEQRRG